MSGDYFNEMGIRTGKWRIRTLSNLRILIQILVYFMSGLIVVLSQFAVSKRR